MSRRKKKKPQTIKNRLRSKLREFLQIEDPLNFEIGNRKISQLVRSTLNLDKENEK